MKKRVSSDTVRYAPRRTYEEIERTADLVREALELDHEDRVQMLPLLEYVLPALTDDDFQLRVVDDDQMKGIEGLTDLDKPIITFPASVYQALYDGNPRARFTAAHEFGHFILHNNQPMHYARVSRADHRFDPEWQANAFAAAFLMPSIPFRTCRTIEEVKIRFGVGYLAARNRAKDLKHRFKNSPITKKGTNAKRRSP